jgi:thioredoxin-related protein
MNVATSPRLLACCLVCCLSARALAQAPAPEVQWRTDYGKARQEAVEKGRLIVIDVGTENCFYCKQLDLRTFRDPAVVSLLNQRCIPLKIDANQQPKLAADLRADTFPTLVFATAEGKILGTQVGFVEAPAFQDLVQRALSTASVTPDWMSHDFDEAGKAVAKGDYARAVGLLQAVVQDGKDRPVQTDARKLLQEVEDQAASRCARAKALIEQGKVAEAVELVVETLRVFAGTRAAREGSQMLVSLAGRAGGAGAPRAQAARELLAQARADFNHKDFLRCLDRCDALVAAYADLPEAAEAGKLAAEIKANPDATRQACEQMGEKMSALFLTLAENWLKKGQPQQAVFYLERVVQGFPNSRHAELAQVRLAQIQGSPLRITEVKKPRD